MTTAWILSDLHVDGLQEWDDPILRGPHPDCDVIIMAGDLANGDFDVVPWLQETFTADELAKTVYVPGNHDRRNVGWKWERLGLLSQLGMTVLDDGVAQIAGHTIVGATLWTGLAVGAEVYPLIGDFKHIPDFSPEYWQQLHQSAIHFLRETVRPGDIVVTHHAPSWDGLSGDMQHNPRQMAFGGAYASDLRELLADLQPGLWVHGHTHITQRYEVAGVPVVTNAKGPIGIGFDPNFTVELDGYNPCPKPPGK